MGYGFHKILIASSLSVLVFSCGTFNWTTNSGASSESIAEIKKRIWNQTPRDQASALNTVLNFEIKDDGRGFDMQNEAKNNNAGLKNMSTRTKLLGGVMTVFSEAGNGTSLNFEIPYTNDGN